MGSLIKVGSSVSISVKWGSYCRGKSEQMFLILSGIAQHVLHRVPTDQGNQGIQGKF